MKFVENWRVLIKRAASIRLAGLVVILATSQSVLLSLSEVDFAQLPISYELAMQIQVWISSATALCGVLTIIARLLQQASITGDQNGKG